MRGVEVKEAVLGSGNVITTLTMDSKARFGIDSSRCELFGMPSTRFIFRYTDDSDVRFGYIDESGCFIRVPYISSYVERRCVKPSLPTPHHEWAKETLSIHDLLPSVSISRIHASLVRHKGDQWLAIESLVASKKRPRPSELTLEDLERSLGGKEASYVFSVTDALRSLRTHCVLCGDRLPAPVWFPSPCSRTLCGYASCHPHTRIERLESLLVHKKAVTDLMLTLFIQAVQNSRFPEHYFPDRILGKDVDRLKAMVKRCPTMDEMRRMKHELTTRLGAIDSLLYEVFQWVVRPTTFFLKVNIENVLSRSHDVTEFRVVQSDVGTHDRFVSLKATHGSFYAWHGSPLRNWHSILRNGLQNQSGTKYMSNGCAYGSGIYLANDWSTSYRYSGRPGGSEPRLVALCEVIDDPRSYRRTRNLVIVQKPECVLLRVLLWTTSDPGLRSAEDVCHQLPSDEPFNDTIPHS